MDKHKFTDYISYTSPLHPKIAALSFPPIASFQHLILYGPPGVGKYTQMLSIVHQYSTLKCEKRLPIDTTPPRYIKISDIHYEVDMELLGCNSKPLWNDIYDHIHGIIQSKYTEKHGIIVCKNFHKINHELLDIFYSYMQGSIKYILITEAISFLPDNILSKCKVLSMPRPSRETYAACLNVPIPETITNLKTVMNRQPNIDPIQATCTKLLHSIKTLNFTMSELREDLYTILVFNLNVERICLYLITHLPNKLQLVKETVLFLQYFNNNYRPIYHLEKYIYSLMTIVHNLKNINIPALK
jgi:hypothetical protein